MKNIILDVDGTLWDTTEVVSRAWNKAVSKVGKTKAKITPTVLKKEFGKPMDVIGKNLFYDLNNGERKILLDLCCQYEHEELEKNTDNLLFPNVKDTLKKLSEKCRLFIVSNCQSGYIELFMEKAKIEKYISDYECFGNTGKSKGENIKQVVERNHLDNAIYVGDTQGDYEATIFAGIPFVYAEYGFGNTKNYNLAISNIKELLDLC